MGRPTKLTKELVESVELAVKAGNNFDAAAAFSGISRRTFYNYIRQGRDDIAADRTTPHSELVERIEVAAGTAETRMVAIIATAATKHWQAAAWWLERKSPDKWGQRQRRDGMSSDETKERQLKEHEAWLRSARSKK